NSWQFEAYLTRFSSDRSAAQSSTKLVTISNDDEENRFVPLGSASQDKKVKPQSGEEVNRLALPP
ncbi:AAEL001284-PA, partial [Aedes aegypti]